MIQVTLVYAPAARQIEEQTLLLPEGATVAHALAASGCVLPADVQVGVWGLKAALTHTLRPHDRIELYRPLTVDPKVARRERFKRQGRRGAGLFARAKVPNKAKPKPPEDSQGGLA